VWWGDEGCHDSGEGGCVKKKVEEDYERRETNDLTSISRSR
jgi:hypothetical protein